MSRIEEALKRARGGGANGERPAGSVAEPPPSPSRSVPSADVFRSPWTFEGSAAEGVSTPEELEPAEEPGRAVEPPRSAAPPADSPSQAAAAATANVWATLLGEATPPPGVAPDAAQPSAAADPARPRAAAGGGAAAPSAGPTPASSAPTEPSSARPEPGPPTLALFQGFSPSLAEKIVAAPDIRPAFAEQYRKLAGVLHHAQLEHNIKVVMVTSAVAGEGKTLTATNLALTFSESYRRSVLLVDADLRRPTLHEYFQVPNVTGLGDGLRSEKEQKLSLVQVSPRLTLLTAGRPDPDPMSGLTSDRMRRVIAEASARFDWVFIDTPPVGLLPDAKLLAAMVDTTLMVIEADRTPYALIRRAVDAIGRDRIFGVVLNRARNGAGGGGYEYYSYYDRHGRAAK
jgi:capsular exopolysaccharide synthesis family protein